MSRVVVITGASAGVGRATARRFGAKHAIEGFTETLRTELLHDGSHVDVTLVQLPAHNTPQFSWGRTKMPEHPQPVPPIFQPEVAADAIFHAAHRPRKEFWVGWPTAKAILAERVAPKIGDRYLAKTGFQSQQTEPALAQDRPGNLFEPPPGDPGAHGDFDEQAKSRSWLWWANANRERVGLATGAAGALVAAAVLSARNGRGH